MAIKRKTETMHEEANEHNKKVEEAVQFDDMTKSSDFHSSTGQRGMNMGKLGFDCFPGPCLMDTRYKSRPPVPS